MTDNEFERTARAWLDDGPNQISDRAVQSALDQIHVTRQRRAWWPARRFSSMGNPLRLVAGLAAVVLASVIGLSLLPGGGFAGGLVGPPPSPTPTPLPTPIPSPLTVGDPAPMAGRHVRHGRPIPGPCHVHAARRVAGEHGRTVSRGPRQDCRCDCRGLLDLRHRATPTRATTQGAHRPAAGIVGRRPRQRAGEPAEHPGHHANGHHHRRLPREAAHVDRTREPGRLHPVAGRRHADLGLPPGGHLRHGRRRARHACGSSTSTGSAS